MSRVIERNALEVLSELDERIREIPAMQGEAAVPYYVLGGLGVAALKDSRTDIITEERLIVPPSDLYVSNWRPKTHSFLPQTRRDSDILVGTTDPALVYEVYKATTEVIGDELEVSVFGLKRFEDARKDSGLQRTLKSWLSSRTLDEAGQLRYTLGPVEQVVNAEIFEPWNVLLPNGENVISTMHPVHQLKNYYMRSITGLRSKDQSKIDEVEKVLATNEQMDYLLHGVDSPFRACDDFVRKVSNYRRGDAHRYYDISKKEAVLAERKARALGWLEGHETIVSLALNGPVQKALNFAIGTESKEPEIDSTKPQYSLHYPA